MVIRKATLEDISELVRVINLAYRVEDFFINGDRTNETDIRNRMQKPNAQFLIIEDEITNNLAGAVYIEIRNKRGYYGLLSIEPKYQKKGLAKRLINEVEEYCLKVGCSDIDIDVVNLREELPPFYEHLGYHFTGETSAFKDISKLKKEAHFLYMTKKLK
ncbi:MAG TPA: GNAT family N-acetyltransferase [Ignavibacteriaceae bacterium]|nr:GNAT family N-acetyltransferase [Ignavibacteriaceae bacterium]